MKYYKYNSEKLDFEEVRHIKYLIISCGVLFILLLSSFFIPPPKITEKEMEKIIDLRTNSTFTKEKLIQEIKDLPFEYKEIVYAQCILESSNFSSPVFIENNNFLGMREARQRSTTAIGTNLKHAQYRNWRECLLDRLLYEAKYMHNLSKVEYFNYLNGYAENPKYVKTLKNLIEKNKLERVFEN
jgi:hypothetical protein